jgi:hypothetical protein
VDLRLVEHAGGLSVSVRSSDSSLTRGLQEHLPELSDRLEAARYQTQTWLPAASQTPSGGSSTGEHTSEERGGRPFSQGGSSQSGGQGSNQNSNGQGNRREQEGQAQAPPAWPRPQAQNNLTTATETAIANSID